MDPELKPLRDVADQHAPAPDTRAANPRDAAKMASARRAIDAGLSRERAERAFGVTLD